MSIVDDQQRSAVTSRTMVPMALDTAGVISAAGVGLRPLADALRRGRADGGEPPAAGRRRAIRPSPCARRTSRQPTSWGPRD